MILHSLKREFDGGVPFHYTFFEILNTNRIISQRSLSSLPSDESKSHEAKVTFGISTGFPEDAVSIATVRLLSFDLVLVSPLTLNSSGKLNNEHSALGRAQIAGSLTEQHKQAQVSVHLKNACWLLV